MNYKLLLLSLSFLYSTNGSLTPLQGSGTDCSQTISNLQDGDYGFLQSPSYPGSYRPGLDCEWRFKGAPGTVVVATVFDMRTQNAILSDISDSLYISLNGNWNDSQRFSGDLAPITPMVFVSEKNSFAVRFRSSQFTQGDKGFRIGYFVRHSNTGKPAVSEPAHDVYVVVFCNYVPVDHPQVFPEEGISLKESRNPPRPPKDESNRTNSNPFLVALILDDSQFCSGTLISDRHILTSAHCTKGVNKIDMIFGTENLMVNDNGVQRRQVGKSSVIQHPNFDTYTGENDMSVIVLDNSVEITRLVVPAALPDWSYMGTTFTGFKGEVVGWGDSTSGTIYNQANRKTIQVSSNAACSIRNRGHTGLSMCSRSSTGSTCQADSGSPIVASRAYCNGPVEQNNNGNNGINNNAQKPPKPGKPSNVKPNRPGKPNKPGQFEFKLASDVAEKDAPVSKYQANVLLGFVSHGSCEKGFSFIRITSQLDFLSKFVRIHSDT